MKFILDIGCGINKYKGKEDEVVIGIDRADTPAVDIVHDMEDFPYPFENQKFDKIVMHHTLEHVSRENMTNIKIIEEIYRLLKPNGILVVDVPIGGWFSYDPTHRNYVCYWYWLYFKPNFPLNYYSTARFEMIDYNVMQLCGVPFVGMLRPIVARLHKMNPGAIERIISFIKIDAAIQYKLRKVKN
jgi:predicted SAM-dependent methyltransferase